MGSLWDHSMVPVQWGAVVGAALAGAIFDVSTRRIPNLLTGPVLLLGLIWASWIGGWAGLGESLLACVVLALPYILLFIFAGGGAGDAKLMGALGAWLGWVNGVAVLVAVSFSAIVLAVCFALARRQLRSVLATVAGLIWHMLSFVRGFVKLGINAKPEGRKRSEGELTVPYGLAIFAGACIAAVGVLVWRAQ